MGHDIVRCDFCGKDVMEGRNDWECDCGAICDQSTNYRWEKKVTKKNKSNSEKFNSIIDKIKLKPDLIL